MITTFLPLIGFVIFAAAGFHFLIRRVESPAPAAARDIIDLAPAHAGQQVTMTAEAPRRRPPRLEIVSAIIVMAIFIVGFAQEDKSSSNETTTPAGQPVFKSATGVDVPQYPVDKICNDAQTRSVHQSPTECVANAQKYYSDVKIRWNNYSASVQRGCIEQASTPRTYDGWFGASTSDAGKPYLGLYFCLLDARTSEQERQWNAKPPAFKP